MVTPALMCSEPAGIQRPPVPWTSGGEHGQYIARAPATAGHGAEKVRTPGALAPEVPNDRHREPRGDDRQQEVHKEKGHQAGAIGGGKLQWRHPAQIVLHAVRGEGIKHEGPNVGDEEGRHRVSDHLLLGGPHDEPGGHLQQHQAQDEARHGHQQDANELPHVSHARQAPAVVLVTLDQPGETKPPLLEASTVVPVVVQNHAVPAAVAAAAPHTHVDVPIILLDWTSQQQVQEIHAVSHLLEDAGGEDEDANQLQIWLLRSALRALVLLIDLVNPGDEQQLDAKVDHQEEEGPHHLQEEDDGAIHLHVQLQRLDDEKAIEVARHGQLVVAVTRVAVQGCAKTAAVVLLLLWLKSLGSRERDSTRWRACCGP
mmetsp:Transcript_98898/g.235921  ORF Transcript_98898/g.235921 Transcript_98898/m.235921 type:complete len:371 (+) Transcript_98898:174-1286(+)